MAYEEKKLLRRGDVCKMLHISYATLHRRIKDGSIRDGTHLGGAANTWKVWERSYIESLLGDN